MTKTEQVVDQWQDARNGLIKEVELIPAEKMTFKPAAESRSVIELLHHVVESERMLAGEMCRENTNFQRGFAGLMADFTGGVKDATTKDAVIELLRSSMEETKKNVLGFGDTGFEKMMRRFDGKQCTKLSMLNFTVSHEMYHRGQLTVYERILGIEPALTQLFKKMMSTNPE
jgi:uncharacterized damage-inducible protein DinB